MLPPYARPSASVAPLHYIPNFLFFNLIFQLDDESALLTPGWNPLFSCPRWAGGKVIRLRRKPRALPVDECADYVRIIHCFKYCCFGGFRLRRITLRSLGVGGYSMEVPRALPVGLHFLTEIYSLGYA